MSHQTKRPFDSVECSTPHDLLIRCSLSNLQFPAIALTWCGLTSHRHRSIEPFFMSLAARDSEFRRWSGRVDRRICQTFAASPAEPGELPLGFRRCQNRGLPFLWDQFGGCPETAQAASGMEAARSSIWLGRNSLAQAMPQTPGGTAISFRHAYAVAASGLISTA
jgi:hypothetical protein